MKKLILILFLVNFSLSCSGQRIEQLPLVKTNATVHAIIGEEAIITVSSELSYTVPAGNLEVDKEYVFWLEVTGCKTCKSRKANIAGAVYTTSQVQKDQRAASESLSNRKIIKQ